MKKIWLVIILCLFSFPLISQTVESATKRMNSGQYEIAKSYWEALNDKSNRYANKIEICDLCNQLQKEAKQLIGRKRYSKAIEKYLAILDKNPSDIYASSQIDVCKQLRDEYIANNSFQTYTNKRYGYSIKIPAYLNTDAKSDNDIVIYWSSDFKISVTLKATIDYENPTNYEILKKISPPNNTATITYRKTKDNWNIISGHLDNDKIFYKKSFISNRKSQYGEPIRIVVTATAISPKYDKRGKTIAEAIHKYLNIDTFGQPVKVLGTEEDWWKRIVALNTIEGYNNYISYASTESKHKNEAIARKSVLEARTDYKNGKYAMAKTKFESGEQYLTEKDMDMYAYSYYIFCKDHNNTIEELYNFCNKFPNFPHIRVIRGCIVKTYCSKGNYSNAKHYVKVHKNIWYDENTPFSNRQWRKYIRKYKRSTKNRK